jgi:hypothetical protein
LQKKGRWIVIPPTDIGRHIGVIVCDKFGNVEMIGDQEMITDINAMNTYASKIELPDISHITEKRKALRVLYGLNGLTVKETVLMVQRTFNVSKPTLMWMADSGSIANFPVTSDQINKHWQVDPCYVKGHIQRRKVSARQYEDLEISSPPIKTSKEGSSKMDTETIFKARDIVIGHEVCTDIYGPILGLSMVSFKDKASGYCSSFALKDNGKADMSLALIDCINTYRRFNHHSNEFGVPIDTMRSDSEAVYRASAADVFFFSNLTSCLFTMHPNKHSPVHCGKPVAGWERPELTQSLIFVLWRPALRLIYIYTRHA